MRAQQGWSSAQAPKQVVAGGQLTVAPPTRQSELVTWRRGMTVQVSAWYSAVRSTVLFQQSVLTFSDTAERIFAVEAWPACCWCK